MSGFGRRVLVGGWMVEETFEGWGSSHLTPLLPPPLLLILLKFSQGSSQNALLLPPRNSLEELPPILILIVYRLPYYESFVYF